MSTSEFDETMGQSIKPFGERLEKELSAMVGFRVGYVLIVHNPDNPKRFHYVSNTKQGRVTAMFQSLISRWELARLAP